MADNTENQNPAEPEIDPRGVHPDAPVQKSPVLWMALVMITLVVLTTISMWGREKISIKANPIIPELSALAQHGRDIINSQCAECHGEDATGGSRKGPPLMHTMYREEVYPDHHFRRVLKEGRPQKNWKFGPMPPQPQLSAHDMDGVIAFIREVHDASGVE